MCLARSHVHLLISCSWQPLYKANTGVPFSWIRLSALQKSQELFVSTGAVLTNKGYKHTHTRLYTQHPTCANSFNPHGKTPRHVFCPVVTPTSQTRIPRRWEPVRPAWSNPPNLRQDLPTQAVGWRASALNHSALLPLEGWLCVWQPPGEFPALRFNHSQLI